MNTNLLLPIIRALLPREKLQEFDRGIETLKRYGEAHRINSFSDALGALKDLNVPKDFLSNTGRLVSNPVVSKIASVCNVDVDKIQQDVEKLSASNTDTLQRFKDDLAKLK